jgi:hypothetical protein
MLSRLLGFGVASLVALGLIGLSLLMRVGAQQATPIGKATTALARDLNDAVDRTPLSRVGWEVTKATSAHHAMVVDVDADHLDRAGAIAMQIVGPLEARGYDEVLIYVRQPGTREPAVRRVQWTPNGGFVETTYADR